MVWERDQSRANSVWALAAAQHGVVTRRQLIARGLSQRAIEHRLAVGRLHRIERGIYAVGRPELSRRGRWMMAVLSCGSGAALSHRSAAALWGFGSELPGRIEVSVPFPSPRRRHGIHVHRRPGLSAADVTVADGIALTRPVLTLIDLARCLEKRSLERAINEADRLDVMGPESLLRGLDDYTARPGVGTLRRLLIAQVFRLTDSELERRFLRLVNGAKLPLPDTGVRLNGVKVDFFWPQIGLVVETDGLRYHRTPAQQRRDRERDQAHTAAGLTTLRFTHAQVHSDPKLVQRTLLRVIRRLGAASAPRRSLRSPGA
jgi:very-short-patch-repair endonuclease